MSLKDKKINYLVAACAHRLSDAAGCIEITEVLRCHMEELLKTDLTQLDQIAILQALPIERNGINFSLMFDGKLADYASNYRVLFNVNLIECTHDGILDKEDIFNPVQYTVKQKAAPYLGIY